MTDQTTNDIQLDQLWYTWSTNGMGSQSMGFRVRAASSGLYDMQGMRYRRVDRFLRYDLPKGITMGGFEQRFAPITLAFIHNGEERLLVRKVFTGLDAAGRNSSFFSHLIAGLPESFTARDAIRLWICPKLWVDSEQGKAYNDTHLTKIAYSELAEYVQQSQTMFSFDPISEQLTNILQMILSQGIPTRIHLRGQSIFSAALIYGIAHCLPMTLLKDLTFTTYESEIDKFEATILGTLSAEDMAGGLTLQLNPAAPTTLVSDDIQKYVSTVVNCLLENNTAKLNRMIDMAETNGYATSDLLISLYKLRFRSTPLTIEQLKSIVYYSKENIDDLLDPSTPQEGADLLLREVDDWQHQGEKFFQSVVDMLAPGGQFPYHQEVREALVTFLHKMEMQVMNSMLIEITQGTIPNHAGSVLLTLAPPKRETEMWRAIIIDFPQKPEVEAKIASDTLWPFREWVVNIAKILQPLPTLEQMSPWLRTSSWEKLGKLLKLNLPPNWEQAIIVTLLERIEREIPKSAMNVIQAYETKFKEVLQVLLQRGYQQKEQRYTEIVVRFFAVLVEREYQDSVVVGGQTEQAKSTRSLLLRVLSFLLNVSEKEPTVIEQLFTQVSLTSPSRLRTSERDWILTNLSPEVIGNCVNSSALLTYLHQWLLLLIPASLANESNQNLLGLLSVQSSLPTDIKELVDNWMIILNSQRLVEINRGSLKNFKYAVLSLLAKQQEQRGQVGTQEEQERRKPFVTDLVPGLVKQVKSEPSLEDVLQIMGDELFGSRWELLTFMASIAGRRYCRHDLSRLTPYLLYGVREHERLGRAGSQSRLYEYLQNLYGGLDEAGLRDVDINATLKTWPPEVGRFWQDWRQRINASRQRSVVSNANRALPAPRPQVVQPSSHQPSRANQLPGASSMSNNTPMQPEQASQQIFPPQSLSARTSKSVEETLQAKAFEYNSPIAPQQVEQGQQLIVPPPVSDTRLGQQTYPVATIGKLGLSISYTFYRKMQQNILPVLNFWLRTCKLKRENTGSRSVKFEVATLEALLKELQKPATSGNIIVKKLVEYLVDNELIKDEMQLLVNRGVPRYWFDEDKLINIRIVEFKESIIYISAQTDEDIKMILRIFIRRDLFIQYLDQEGGIGGIKSKIQGWLEKRRKEAKISIK